MKKILFLLLSTLFFLGGCSTTTGNQSSGKTGTYQNITTNDAKNMIDKKEADVLDVRTVEEYAQGHIPGASNLPLQNLQNQLSTLDKKKSYVIVCRSGNRSSQASELLSQNGFEKIYNMQGGMNQWKGQVEK